MTKLKSPIIRACVMLSVMLFLFGCEAFTKPDVSQEPSMPSASITPAANTPAATPVPTPSPTPTPDPREVWVEERLDIMTIDEKIGQLFICRIPGGTVHTVNDATRELLASDHIGGFILFSENVKSIEQVQELTAGLQNAAGEMQSADNRPATPLFISVDEEGGRVSRIGNLYEESVESANKIGEEGDLRAAYDMGQTIGGRLSELGINMDFAPVADIWSNEKNKVIGDRAFGREPEPVGANVAAAVRGLKSAGVLSVIKHFPGHGETNEDSHKKLAVYPHDKSRFDSFESVPFREGIKAGADGVMVGHIAAPALTAEEDANAAAVKGMEWLDEWRISGKRPAVFSSYLMGDVLRGEMGFDGLIVTDALEMKALTDSFTDEQIALGAFISGADILLIPRDPSKAVQALRDAYADGLITEARINESVRRILWFKESLQ